MRGVFIRIEGCSPIRIEGCPHTAPAAGAPSVNRCNPLQALTGNKRAICTSEVRSGQSSASVHDLDIVGGRWAGRHAPPGRGAGRGRGAPSRRPPGSGPSPGRNQGVMAVQGGGRVGPGAARARPAGLPQTRRGPSPGAGSPGRTRGAARREHDQMASAGPAQMLLTWAAVRRRKGAECFEPSFNWGNLRKPLYKASRVQ